MHSLRHFIGKRMFMSSTFGFCTRDVFGNLSCFCRTFKITVSKQGGKTIFCYSLLPPSLFLSLPFSLSLLLCLAYAIQIAAASFCVLTVETCIRYVGTGNRNVEVLLMTLPREDDTIM